MTAMPVFAMTTPPTPKQRLTRYHDALTMDEAARIEKGEERTAIDIDRALRIARGLTYQIALTTGRSHD